MATVTIRNLPDAVHRAIRVRAAQHGRSTEAEIREILEAVAIPRERLKLGNLLVAIAQEAGGLSEAEIRAIDQARDRTPAEPLKLE